MISFSRTGRRGVGPGHPRAVRRPRVQLKTKECILFFGRYSPVLPFNFTLEVLKKYEPNYDAALIWREQLVFFPCG